MSSYQARKVSILHELESAIRKKTLEKNKHREIAKYYDCYDSKNLQCSIDKKKEGQSKERFLSSYLSKLKESNAK